MSSLTYEYFIEKGKEVSRRLIDFNKWCEENEYLSLTQWFSQFPLLNRSDFFDKNLVDEFQPTSMPETIVISSKGHDYLFCYKENDMFMSSIGTDAFLFFCVRDSAKLYNLFTDQIKRRELLLQQGRPFVDDKPFHERGYIDGPYCDLEALPSHLTLTKKRECFCDWCGTSIYDKPKFLIARSCLCYRCSKIAYERLTPLAKKLSEANKTHNDDVIERHKTWSNLYRQHINRKGLFTKLSEYISGDKNQYIQKFLVQNPEPASELLQPVIYVVLCPYDSPFIGHKTTRKWILKRDERMCQICEISSSEDKLEIHHVLPKASGGADIRTNLITLCLECHESERWFGHIKAFASFNGGPQQYSWDWEIVPPFLSKSNQELLNDSLLFAPKFIIDSQSDWEELKQSVMATEFLD